jgi:hypothetical protein
LGSDPLAKFLIEHLRRGPLVKAHQLIQRELIEHREGQVVKVLLITGSHVYLLSEISHYLMDAPYFEYGGGNPRKVS